MSITVIILNPESYPESRSSKTKELIETLRGVGIDGTYAYEIE